MFSVIIPTCNRNELLGKCLDTLAPGKQTFAAFDYEVIVTDDSKDDIARPLIQENYLFAKWVKGPSKGPAANRNNGAKYAKGEWLVFIDDDCVPDENLLEEYFKGIHLHPQALAFEGAIQPDSWKLLKKDMAECPVNTNGGCFWSANICVNTRLFNKVGGFDERYKIAAHEDQQMKIDIEAETKNKIFFLEAAKVCHPVRFSSLKNKLFGLGKYSKNFCLYAHKNRVLLGYDRPLYFLKDQFRIHIKTAVLHLRDRKIKNFLNEMFWVCFGVPLNAYNFFLLSRNLHQALVKSNKTEQ